ncbi:VanZ family protein [Leifsonia sp. NPDC058248]|uniref:VanZ family protein n=1 Tax=Leifsonia sp. NPDC058248 TaxID=3346402 RepID=UPI0036DB5769
MIRRHPWLSALTALYLVAVAWITLVPTQAGTGGVIQDVLDLLARTPLAAGLSRTDVEFAANVLLFVPMGLLFTLLLGVRRWWAALVIGVGATCFIEVAQLFIPSRVSDVRDLVANTVGTLIGIALTVAAAALLRVRTVRE